MPAIDQLGPKLIIKVGLHTKYLAQHPPHILRDPTTTNFKATSRQHMINPNNHFIRKEKEEENKLLLEFNCQSIKPMGLK